MFFLLFFFINEHKTATANPVNPQQINEIFDAIKYEVYEPKGKKFFEQFLVDKITTYCNKCINTFDVIHEKNQIEENDKEKKSNAAIYSLNIHRRKITNIMDDFRVSLNKDFVVWYKEFGMQDNDIETYHHNELFSLYTIYNFTMLNTYVEFYLDATIYFNVVKDANKIHNYEMKFYNKLNVDFTNITDDFLEDIESTYLINFEKKNKKTLNILSNDINNAKMVCDNNENQIMPSHSNLIYKMIQIRVMYMDFIKYYTIEGITNDGDVKSDREFITRRNLNLEALLKKIDAENTFIKKCKNSIKINNMSIGKQDRIKDNAYKLYSFFVHVKDYAINLKLNTEKLLAIDTNALDFDYQKYKLDISIYRRKTNTLYYYIKYMAQKESNIEQKDGYIKDYQLQNSKKSISNIKLYYQLYVFAYNSINAKSLIAERKKRDPIEEKRNKKTV